MDIAEQAKAKREMAAQARRWAKGMSLNDDRKQLETHAADLDSEAAELERQAAAAHVPSRTVMTQQQPQQLQETEPKPADPTDEDHKLK